MNTVSFPIYEPDGKKFHWSPNTILLLSWFIPLFLWWIFEDYIEIGGTIHLILIYYYCLVGGVSTYYLVAAFFSHEYLHGKIDGDIIFEHDGIIVNKESYKMADITNIDFRFKDFYDKRSTGLQADFNPRISQGVNNYVTFTDKKGDTKLIYFQLNVEFHYKELAPFINEAIKAKKMEFKQGIDLVGIENVSI